MQGKNAGNPDGLPSILTWQKQKLTIENRGSDNSCHPRQSDNPKLKLVDKFTHFNINIGNFVNKAA